MKRPAPSINPLSFGLVYFGLFVLAMLLNKDGQLILFPKPAQASMGEVALELLLAGALGLLVVGISQWLSKYVKALKNLERDFVSMLGPLSMQDVFFLAVFSSVGEEFLFRGIVQHYLGVVLTALIFGLLHSAPGKQGRAWSLFAITMGLVLGYSYAWTENILVPVVIHAVVNFFNLWLLRRRAFIARDSENG